jgi:hypothetical protein
MKIRENKSISGSIYEMITEKQNRFLHANKSGISSRLCTQCDSVKVSKQRAREQFATGYVHAPFCKNCEDEFRRN